MLWNEGQVGGSFHNSLQDLCYVGCHFVQLCEIIENRCCKMGSNAQMKNLGRCWICLLCPIYQVWHNWNETDKLCVKSTSLTEKNCRPINCPIHQWTQISIVPEEPHQIARLVEQNNAAALQKMFKQNVANFFQKVQFGQRVWCTQNHPNWDVHVLLLQILWCSWCLFLATHSHLRIWTC